MGSISKYIIWKETMTENNGERNNIQSEKKYELAALTIMETNDAMNGLGIVTTVGTLNLVITTV